MSLKRRIMLYILGVLIGGGLAYFFYGERLASGGWLPENRIKLRLASTLIDSRPEARKQLEAWPAELKDLRSAMPGASIDLANSRRTDDSIYYQIQLDVKGRPADLVVAVLRDLDRDTTATLWAIQERSSAQ